MRRPSPPFVVLLLLIAGCYCVALAKASCGSPATVSPPKTCASQSGCALASLCRLYTRMPYPNSAAATATYAPEVYAQWDDILKGAGPEALPGPYDYTVKTRLRIGNSSGGDTLWPLRFANTGVNYYATEYSNKTTAASPRLPVRGKIEYIVTYTLNVTTEYEAPAGAKVSQTTVNLPTNVDLISGGRLAFPLSGIPTKMVVVFEDPPPTDNYAGIISFGSWRDSYQMDGDNNDGIVRTSPGLQFNIEVSLGDDPDDISIPSATISQNEIISAEQTTVYTWTDYGTAVPTGEDTMGGTCSRGSGVTSHTVTCTVDGLPRYVMLEGDPSIVFDASTSISIRQYRTESSKGAENPKDLAVFKSRQNRTSCGAHGIENKCGDNCNVCDPPTTMTCDPKLNAKEDECMEDSDCFLITHVSGKTCVKNTLPILLDVDHYTNPSDKYAVCGVTTRIEGDVYINDMPDNTKGFYLGGCSGSGVTSIDPRTWDSNNVVSTMTELILDDTSIVSAPDVSSLVNLERLSISGDQYDGTMTTLPNITGLTKLKFFNVSRQPAISAIPENYFETNVMIEEIVLASNGILALPANIFRSNINLKVINLGGNELTMADFTQSRHNVTGGLLRHLTKLTHFDISDNRVVGDTVSPLPTNLFAQNLNIEQIFLTNNNITFLSARQFQNNRLLNRLGMGGIFNTFRTSSTCPFGYYVTRIFLPSIEVGQAVYYACDLCEPEEGSELFLSGDSYTCWTDPSNWETHHPPTRCPRGSYCDVATKTQLFCPKGKYNPIAGQDTVASCKNCLDGYYNPMEGQQTCAFQCPPGTYGKHSDVTLGHPATVADSISKCKDCPLGTFCAGQGTVDPVDCPMGKYGEISTSGAQREADRCTNCPEHTYSDTVGAVSAMSCKSCDAGKFSVRGSSRPQDCTKIALAPCPSGEGRKTLNGACALCPRGQFSASGNNPCRLCPNGFYGPNEKAEACVACSSDTAGTSRTANGASFCGFVPGSFGSGARVDSRPSWVSANISLMRASMVPDIQEIPTVNGLQYSQFSASHQGMIDSLKMSLYPTLGCLSLMVLLLHRHCSTKWCRIDLFAAAHMIQDTHALRKVKSRLGGAFTWVLLFAIVAILVQSITGRGFQTIMSDTAERVNQFEYLQAQAEGSGETGFGTLELHIDIFALMQDEQDMADKCNTVYLDRPQVADRLMRCNVKHKSIGATDCGVTITCETTFELIGDAVLPVKLPIEFQTLAWRVDAKTWEYFDSGAGTLSEPWTRFNTTVRAALAPLREGEVLSGTKADPTLTVFGVTRGFADGSQVARKATSSGLQLGYKQTILKFDRVEDYVPQLFHVVNFKFEVLPALHVETTTETLSTIQLAATIFSLIASATKVLKLIKRCLAKGIDEHLKKRVPPPEDVKRRTELLHEDNLMHRRFQKLMSQHSFLKGSGKVPRKHGRGGEAFVALEDKDVEDINVDADAVPVHSMVELGVEMIPVTVSTDAEKEGEEGTEGTEGVQEESSSTATSATRKPADKNLTQIPSLGNSIAKSADESSNDNDKSSQAEAKNVVLRSRVDELEKQKDGLLARLADLESIMSSVTAGAWHARREEALKESKTSVVGKAIDGVGDLLEGGSIY